MIEVKGKGGSARLRDFVPRKAKVILDGQRAAKIFLDGKRPVGAGPQLRT